MSPAAPENAARPTDGAAEREIAALKAENRMLQLQTERARQLLDSATDYAVITMNLDGRVTGWNAGARAMFGYGDTEILGRSGEVFFPAKDRADGVFADELRRALEEGSAVNERWHLRHDGSRFWASGSMMPLLDGDGRTEGFLNVFRDNTVVRAEEEHRALLLAEMSHRVKNTMAQVQAIAAQTLRRAGVPGAVLETFAARLQALARSHDLLIQNEWQSAPLAEVVEHALLPYGAGNRTKVAGPPVCLPPNAAEMLSLAFNELATNAVKYGALSIPEGHVEVCWTQQRLQDGTRRVNIVWRERGGPSVTPPSDQGFGSQLLERGLTHGLGGTAKLDFRPGGLECRVCFRLTGGQDAA